jgi:hypothetical protein
VLVSTFTLNELRQLILETWDECYGDGNEDDLMLNEPSLIVEPDVKAKLRDYLKKMGLTRPRKKRSG